MKAFEALMAGLGSADPVVAGDAARLLGELGRVEASAGLIKYVQRCRHHYKSAGLVALGILGRMMEGAGRAEVIAVLRRMVAHPNVHDDWYWYSCKGVRASAALGLLMLGDDGGAGYLRELAEKQDDVFFCWFGPALLRLEETCAAVGELKSRLTARAILDAGARRTRNTEPGLLTMKAEVLGILGGEEACAALVELARFHSRYVRGQAALSLLEASDLPQHVKAVEAMADGDGAEFVRIKASLGLARAANSERADFVAKAAGTVKDPFERAVAVEALGLLRRKKDRRVVARQVRHADGYVRQCALEALERIDAGAAVAAARGRMKDPAPRVRLQAAKILAGARAAAAKKATLAKNKSIMPKAAVKGGRR